MRRELVGVLAEEWMLRGWGSYAFVKISPGVSASGEICVVEVAVFVLLSSVALGVLRSWLCRRI